MPCESPITIRSVRPIVRTSAGCVGTPGGAHYIQVPCGHCDYCKKVKLDGFVQRLNFEYEHSFMTLFVTYTYDNEHVHRDLSKDDAKTMIQDLKNNLNRAYGSWNGRKLVSSFKFKYFIVGEYGEKRGRVHMHLLLFLPRSVDWSIIQKSNRFGYICDIQLAGSGSLYYCAEYCVKALVSDDNEQYAGKAAPFYLQSNGIGAAFIDSRTAFALRRNKTYNYRDAKGYIHTIPKYLRNKMFDYFERAEISDELSALAASRVPHSVEDRNLRLENLERINSYKLSKVKKSYKNSLL